MLAGLLIFPELVDPGALELVNHLGRGGGAHCPRARQQCPASVVQRFQPTGEIPSAGESFRREKSLTPPIPKPFSAQAVPILPMTSYEPNFWTTIATFCRELAPISGPLLESISQTAAAIDRAGYGTRSLRAELDLGQRQLLPPEDREEGY
jgi:hypothetical protein